MYCIYYFVYGTCTHFVKATSTALGKCVTDFDGTSAATPIASAVIALVLEAK